MKAFSTFVWTALTGTAAVLPLWSQTQVPNPAVSPAGHAQETAPLNATPQAPEPGPNPEPIAGGLQETESSETAQTRWAAREAELLARIAALELELAHEQALRLQREQEWMQFTHLLTLLPEERRPELPAFLKPAAGEEGVDGAEQNQPDAGSVAAAKEERAAQERAQAIKTTLRAYLRAESQHSLDLLEVGTLRDGAIGPIVARQLDGQGRFVSTLVADRLRLEKSESGFTLTLVLESGYERRQGRTWPFPRDVKRRSDTPEAQRPVALDPELLNPEAGDGAAEGTQPDARQGVLRIALAGVDPAPWIKAMPELFSASDRETVIDDGQTNLVGLRFELNRLLELPKQGARWRMVSLGGVVGSEWRDLHLAELDLEGRVVRRLFADRATLRLEGSNAIFEMQSGAQERNGMRSAFLAGRYTLLIPGIVREDWLAVELPGLPRPPEK